MKTLVIAEHDNNTLLSETLKVVKAAQSLAGGIDVVVIGNDCQSVAAQCSELNGVENVKLVESHVYQHTLAENWASTIVEVATEYSHILMSSSTTGKNILPRVAALLDVGQLSDVIEIVSEDTVIRPIYAGNALAKVRSSDRVKVMSIRASAFDEAGGQEACNVEKVGLELVSDNSEFVGQEKSSSDRPELGSAKVVVSGGRGLGSAEQFALVEKLADTLGGAIGASRAAVDAGYVSNDLQVGQTGKIVAPDLYIAVGISGAIQHIAGMKESKVIVAINSDPEAPIFEVADYGLVGDLFEILPELITQLEARS